MVGDSERKKGFVRLLFDKNLLNNRQLVVVVKLSYKLNSNFEFFFLEYLGIDGKTLLRR